MGRNFVRRQQAMGEEITGWGGKCWVKVIGKDSGAIRFFDALRAVYSGDLLKHKHARKHKHALSHTRTHNDVSPHTLHNENN